MIKKVKIAKIFFNTEKQDGTPYTNPFTNEPTTNVVIITDTESRFYGWDPSNGEDERFNSMKEGDEVTLDVTMKGDYQNFKLPKAETLQLDGLEKRVKAIEDYLKLGGGAQQVKETVIEDTDSAVPDDSGTGPLPWEE